MPKSNVVFYSARGGGKIGITIDTQARIMLNAAFLDELKAKDIPIKMYVGYDTVLKRIHLQRADTETDKDGTRPYTFDNSRHYAKVSAFLDNFAIPHHYSTRWTLVDRMNGAYVFERVDVIEGAKTAVDAVTSRKRKAKAD